MRRPQRRGRQGATGRCCRAAAVCWLLWPSAAFGLDPGKPLHQYRLDVWQPERGLPWSSVAPILQTSDGYLWLGGYEGLARFDGARFTVFDKTTTPELPDNNIYALAEDSDGHLWIGTDGGGLTRYSGGAFTVYGRQQGLANERVNDLHAGSGGSLWVATRGGLSRVRDGAIESWTSDEGLSHELVWTALEDRHGVVWLGTDEGLVRMEDDAFSGVSLAACEPSCAILAMHEDRDGHLWIGTDSGDLLRLTGGAVTASWTLPGDEVLDIAQDRDGNLWIGTYGGGLHRLTDGEVETLGARDGMTSDVVWVIEEDREGSLWLGTEGGGLLRLRDTPITPYTTRDGLPHDRVWAVFEDSEDGLWIGTDGGGLAWWREGRRETFRLEDGLPSDVVTALHPAHGNGLWIGTYDGLAHWRGGRISPVPLGGAGPGVIVTALFEDEAEALWVGTDGHGLLRLRAGSTVAYTTAKGLPSDTVRALAKIGGDLWVGLDGGLARLSAGQVTTVGDLAGAFVRALHVGEEGTLWVGTRGQGLARVRADRVDVFTAATGFHDDVVYQILEDGEGRLWMSCNKGIFSVHVQDLDDLARGAITTAPATVFGSSEGMKSIECMGGTQPAGVRRHDGTLWFPTTKGLAAIDPARLARNEVPPPVHVERVLFDGAPVDLRPAAPLELPPGRRELEFHYTGLSLVDPEQVGFRYRLDGYDDDWVDAGPRRSAFYTNLSPGSYRFEVIASNNDGVWNEESANVELYLRPAFHETPVFFAGCLLAVAGLGWALYRFRLRRLHRHNAELLRMQKRLEAKNAEVEAKNAEVQRFTYAVSHDLKSPLITIKGFLGYLERDIAGGKVERVAADIAKIRGASAKMQDLLDEVLKLSRIGTVANTIQELSLAGVAAEAVEIVSGQIAERGAEVTISPDLPVIAGDHTRLQGVYQNLLDNALKYMGDQSGPRIEVGTLGLDGEEHVLFVKDNGMGIDPEYHDKVFGLFEQLDSKTSGIGMGLSLVQRIIEVHGGRMWVESEGVGKGTTFYFTLPA